MCAFIAHACRIYRSEKLRAVSMPGAYERSLDHEPHVELETLVRAVTPPSLWLAFQLAFYGAMMLMAISCVVISAASLDQLSVLLLGDAWALQLTPRLAVVSSCSGTLACASQPLFAATASAGGYIVSAGYAFVVVITLPLALIEVSDAFQAASYAVSSICLLLLMCKFVALAASAPVAAPLHPMGWDSGLVSEVCFWSWCISFAVPMWLDEKYEGLSIERPLFAAFGHRALLDLLLGVSGAAAFPSLPASKLNILDAVASHPSCGTPIRACGILFVIASLLPNITDYAMVASRNLESHIGHSAANAAGIVFPFLVGWMFYLGAAFSTLINVSSPLLNGLVQFVVPSLLFSAYERLDEVNHPPHSLLTGRTVSVLGISAAVSTWRRVALGIAAGSASLIAFTYVFNGSGPAILRASASASDYRAQDR